MRRLLLLASVMSLAAMPACGRSHAGDVAHAPAPVADTVSIAHANVALPAVIDTLVRDYRGAFSSSFEVSWFEPCGAPREDRLWWVTLSEDARQERDSLIKLLPVRPTQGLAVHWRGTVSPKMRMGAGQMGRGSRYMLVTHIISLRPLDGDGGGACGSPSRVGLLQGLPRGSQ